MAETTIYLQCEPVWHKWATDRQTGEPVLDSLWVTKTAGATSANSRRCPGCTTRIPINEFACPDCWVRLPFQYQQPIQATYRRDEQAHQRALHSARAWYRDNQAEVSHG